MTARGIPNFKAKPSADLQRRQEGADDALGVAVAHHVAPRDEALHLSSSCHARHPRSEMLGFRSLSLKSPATKLLLVLLHGGLQPSHFGLAMRAAARLHAACQQHRFAFYVKT